MNVGGADQRGAFLYDGDCAFCSACARFIERRIPTPARVQPWQFADLVAVGLTAADCDQAVQWVDVDGRADSGVPVPRTILAGPAAIAALLRTSNLFWRTIGRVLGMGPVLALAWPAYRLIARNRDRMPGATATCALPAAQRGHAR
jgi:predicted DCC family thiol-disulfide oxidoreductase YuxK